MRTGHAPHEVYNWETRHKNFAIACVLVELEKEREAMKQQQKAIAQANRK